MIKKALSGFDRYSDTDFIDRASTAVKSLTGNPDFLNPEPPLEDIQAAIDAFYEAFLTVKQGAGKQETAIKNQRRHELEALLKRLVVYVNLTAAGDVIKLDSTGLEISKDPSAVGILPAPANFILTAASQPGEVAIQIEKVDRAMGYIVQYRKDGDTAVQELILSKTHGVLTQLTSVTRYFVRVGTLSSDANDLHHYNFTEEKSVVAQ